MAFALAANGAKVFSTLQGYVSRHYKQFILGGAVAYAADSSFDNFEDAKQFDNLNFPLEDESIGGFQTHLKFKSWKKVKLAQGIVAHHAMNIFLPMPLALSAAYSGKFSEADDMTYKRDSNSFSSYADRIDAGLSSAGYSMLGFAEDAVNNDASSMAGNTVTNNAPGMLYQGQTLRNHTFSWRLTPKSKEEQEEIDLIVLSLKLASTSAMANVAGNAENNPYFGGRLMIPHTVSVLFLDDGNINHHLFRTKDCFITSMDVNYTTTGTWAAHMDGSPIETQITINLKEITPVTQQEISMQGF